MLEAPDANGQPLHDLSLRKPAPLSGAWWKWLSVLLMCYVIYGAFFIAGGAVGFGQSGDAARIVFFHVPCAVLSSVCFFAGAYFSWRYIAGGASAAVDARAAASMELGFVFCLLATVTGSIFAGVQWGSYWNWDPRETSIIAMLALYAAYLVFRGAQTQEPDKRARLCGVYALVALIPSIFLIWVVPRLPALQSLHPADTLVNPSKTSWTYKAVLYPSFAAFFLVFCWMFQLRVRTIRLLDARRRGMQGL